MLVGAENVGMRVEDGDPSKGAKLIINLPILSITNNAAITNNSLNVLK